jgi:hypothetical protein
MREWRLLDDGSWQPVESKSDSLDWASIDDTRLLRNMDAVRQQVDHSRRLVENARRLLRAYRAWRLPASRIPH